MGRWGKWHEIETIYHDIDILGKKGLYEIRMVDEENNPIPIPRLGSMDPKGIIYIGKSTRLRPRIEDFLAGRHSGGGMYCLVRQKLRRHDLYKRHNLQYRFIVINKDNIETMEAQLLRRYFRKFCELPPFNSSVPGGK